MGHLIEVVKSQQEAAVCRPGHSGTQSRPVWSGEAVALTQERFERVGVEPAISSQRTWVCLDKGSHPTDPHQSPAERGGCRLRSSLRRAPNRGGTARVEGEQAIFEIHDNGIGIDKGKTGGHFSARLSRLKRDGHGFGLHSAAVLAGSLGGELRALSPKVPAEGASFILHGALGGLSVEDLPSVLVVDDDPSLHEDLRLYLCPQPADPGFRRRNPTPSGRWPDSCSRCPALSWKGPFKASDGLLQGQAGSERSEGHPFSVAFRRYAHAARMERTGNHRASYGKSTPDFNWFSVHRLFRSHLGRASGPP